MEQTVVQAYVRSKKQGSNADTETNIKTNIDPMPYILIAATVILTAVVYWYIAAPVALVGAAGYALHRLAPIASAKEAYELTRPVEAPKPKRHYKHRLTVHQWDGKTVKV